MKEVSITVRLTSYNKMQSILRIAKSSTEDRKTLQLINPHFNQSICHSGGGWQLWIIYWHRYMAEWKKRNFGITSSHLTDKILDESHQTKICSLSQVDSVSLTTKYQEGGSPLETTSFTPAPPPPHFQAKIWTLSLCEWVNDSLRLSCHKFASIIL